jgi:hypothetical protein
VADCSGIDNRVCWPYILTPDNNDYTNGWADMAKDMYASDPWSATSGKVAFYDLSDSSKTFASLGVGSEVSYFVYPVNMLPPEQSTLKGVCFPVLYFGYPSMEGFHTHLESFPTTSAVCTLRVNTLSSSGVTEFTAAEPMRENNTLACVEFDIDVVLSDNSLTLEVLWSCNETESMSAAVLEGIVLGTTYKTTSTTEFSGVPNAYFLYNASDQANRRDLYADPAASQSTTMMSSVVSGNGSVVAMGVGVLIAVCGALLARKWVRNRQLGAQQEESEELFAVSEGDNHGADEDAETDGNDSYRNPLFIRGSVTSTQRNPLLNA